MIKDRVMSILSISSGNQLPEHSDHSEHKHSEHEHSLLFLRQSTAWAALRGSCCWAWQTGPTLTTSPTLDSSTQTACKVLNRHQNAETDFPESICHLFDWQKVLNCISFCSGLGTKTWWFVLWWPGLTTLVGPMRSLSQELIKVVLFVLSLTSWLNLCFYFQVMINNIFGNQFCMFRRSVGFGI